MGFESRRSTPIALCCCIVSVAPAALLLFRSFGKIWARSDWHGVNPESGVGPDGRRPAALKSSFARSPLRLSFRPLFDTFLSQHLLSHIALLQVMSPPVLAVSRPLAPQPARIADVSGLQPVQSSHPLKSTRSRRGTINAACRECRLKKLKVSSSPYAIFRMPCVCTERR